MKDYEMPIPQECDGAHQMKDGVCQNAECGFKYDEPFFTFDGPSHTYQLNGAKLTGTTTVLNVLSKPALIPWAARMAVEHVQNNFPSFEELAADPTLLTQLLADAKVAHTKRKDDAAAHGTDAHTLVESWIKLCKDGRPETGPLSEEYEPIRKFIDWAIANVDRFLFTERMMYDAGHWFAGTADFGYVGKDGKRYVGDFKTSSGIYGIDYFLQVAAYRHLAELAGDEPYDGMSIVRLGKDGKFEVQRTFEYEMFRNTFFSCLAIYRAQARAAAYIQKIREARS